MKNRLKIFLSSFFVLCSLFFVFSFIVSPVLAVDKGLQGATGRLKNVETDVYGANGAVPFAEVAGRYINGALALLGVVFLVLLVYGGYIWMIARGEEAEVTKAKDTIKMAVIGLIIVLAAYAITYYVVSTLSVSSGLAPI
ncbi:MAG: hypothetical protein AAB568_03645 [Patescibacteria group bacterium]